MPPCSNHRNHASAGFSFAALLFLWVSLPAYADLVLPSSRVISALNVRGSPAATAPVISQLRPGDAALLIDSTNYWRKIALPSGTAGYVSKSWSTVEPDLRLGTWNLKKLGHGTSKDFATVATIINDNFDILTVIEVMQKGLGHPGYDTLIQSLGPAWAGVISETPRPSTTAGDAEYYAIMYRLGTVQPCVDVPAMQYFPDNDGSPTGTGPDLFVREPAFACFETLTTHGGKGWDFILAAYHATWADGEEDVIAEEVDHLNEVFPAMQQLRPGESDLFVVGDFNLTPEILEEHTSASNETTGTGSTLNSKGIRTTNLYDHLMVWDVEATAELVMPARVLDVRETVSSDKIFYKTVSDHLPIVGRFYRDRTDDD